VSAPCFDKDFFAKCNEDYDRMVQIMKGAVSATRAGTDEALRQVNLFYF